jgi:hypothetical protein
MRTDPQKVRPSSSISQTCWTNRRAITCTSTELADFHPKLQPVFYGLCDAYAFNSPESLSEVTCCFIYCAVHVLAMRHTSARRQTRAFVLRSSSAGHNRVSKRVDSTYNQFLFAYDGG